jgi:hypothetical protein
LFLEPIDFAFDTPFLPFGVAFALLALTFPFGEEVFPLGTVVLPLVAVLELALPFEVVFPLDAVVLPLVAALLFDAVFILVLLLDDAFAFVPLCFFEAILALDAVFFFATFELVAFG